MASVDQRIRLAAASRDGHLALRRVERQQAMIERLYAARGERVQMRELASEFDLPEVAALMSSLAVLGPSVSESAGSAMRKLAEALKPRVTA